ncbi:DASH family cryptochrome [Undibacterium jejuense]|uniref:Cryptochrome DASH n=1 Tax=Undibacterium jejuense TaxID=1344949 RepID=A0A923HIL2_9BURK|nr:DASH family cryptochrome [Undibacterium jejuense]MBC3863710.1 DASH family cryptochrome [Undibacterium jejuense]
MLKSTIVNTSSQTQPSQSSPKKIVIYWFRNDLRIEDNTALVKACQVAEKIVFVYCHVSAIDVFDSLQRCRLPKSNGHRQQFIADALTEVRMQLEASGNTLLELHGSAAACLPQLASEINAKAVYCEEIAAPYEQDEVHALRSAGLHVHTVWQSSLLDPADLPFTADALPQVFTQFRQVIEAENVRPRSPAPKPAVIPALPDNFNTVAARWIQLETKRPKQGALMVSVASMPTPLSHDPRSSFPHYLPAFSGGASAARNHLQNYLTKKLPHTYKLTRNQLSGHDYSTKFAPWLASGALSARQIYQELKEFETNYGANEGSYWIWFELLWRDYFRFLHLQYGRKLYAASGLTQAPTPTHHEDRFEQWCMAKTAEPLVNAGMRELYSTGFLSNRLRQIVASYLIYDLECDWRAGAAWFEASLIDYDVYSNQGNWLYIAGCGTDPRHGRRFNIQKQMHDHDRDGSYQGLWNTF